MTVPQKLWLVGKLETQALYGTQVTVTGHYGTEWTKVAIPSQPTNRDPRGYPGWVPTRQLTGTPPASARVSAVVRSRLAWLWSGWTSTGVAGTHLMHASYNTRLPVVSSTPTYVVVPLIGGQRAGREVGLIQCPLLIRHPHGRQLRRHCGSCHRGSPSRPLSQMVTRVCARCAVWLLAHHRRGSACGPARR